MRISLFLAGIPVALVVLAAACGGGGEEESPTAAPPVEATETVVATATTAATEGTPNPEEVASAVETAKTGLQETITKAQAGDVEGTADAFDEADQGLHTIIDALVPVDPSLADSIEALEEDEIEDQLDSANPDLAAVADAAQEMLGLVDQAATTLGVSP